jgi:hypothetical protein
VASPIPIWRGQEICPKQRLIESVVTSGAYSTRKDGATMKVKVLSELAVVETIVATKSWRQPDRAASW